MDLFKGDEIDGSEVATTSAVDLEEKKEVTTKRVRFGRDDLLSGISKVNPFYNVVKVDGGSNFKIELTTKFKEALTDNKDFMLWKIGTPLPELPKLTGSFSLESLFKDSRVIKLDLSKWNTQNCISMESMFENCTRLVSVGLSSFNTSAVENMCSMFENCIYLVSVDLSSFNTSSVKDMCSMFANCSNFREIDVSSFDTSSVGDMSYMFVNCIRLSSLELKHFVTDNAKYEHIVSGCRDLRMLDGEKLIMTSSPAGKDRDYHVVRWRDFSENSKLTPKVKPW